MGQSVPTREGHGEVRGPAVPSVLVPDVLPGLPALGHGALVTSHPGAFHNLREPEGAVFFIKKIFL